jgi:membrane-anchored mycosin MYCP
MGEGPLTSRTRPAPAGRTARRVLALAAATAIAATTAAPGLAAAAPAAAPAGPAPAALAAPAPPAAPPTCGPSRTDQVTETPWPLRRLSPELVWPLTQGQGVVVAVIDSGVSTTHPALKDAVLPGKDYFDAATAGQCDESAHGSIVAGVIAGRRAGAFSGVAPRARILPIRVLRDTEETSDASVPANIADAIRFAADNDADVINLSLVTQPTPALADAVQYALSKNVVLIAAAGNDGGSQQEGPAYPAAYDGVIAVAGIDEQDKHVSTSTSGDFVDVAAPGANVVGPVPQGGGFAQFEAGGTSFAAAYVAGLAALLRGQDSRISPAEVTRRITGTADHPPESWNPQVGYGVINPGRALTTVRQGGPTAPPNAGPLERSGPDDDPLAGTRRVAILTATALTAATIVVLLTVAAVRRARGLRRRHPEATS